MNKNKSIVISAASMGLVVIGLAVSSHAKGMHPYPLWPSDPVPGWPGVGADSDHTIAKLTGGSPRDPRPAIYGQPELLAYPGAVHHIRRDLQRYVPPYPMCNQNTLLKNFVLNEMKDFSGDCTDFAEPVYYNDMYMPRSKTQQTRPPVKAYQWKKGSAPIKLELGKLKRSMYVIRPICAAPGVEKAWPATYTWFKLRINDLPNDEKTMNGYIMAGRVIDNFYAIQDFFFHSRGDGRKFRMELSLLSKSDRDVLLYNIDLHDRFAELAKRRGKKRTTLTDASKRRSLWEENRTKKAKNWERLQSQQRTPEDQKAFDDLVWQMSLPPMNAMYIDGRGIQFYKYSSRDALVRAPDEWKNLVEQYDFSKAGKDYYALFTHGHARPRGPLFLQTKDGKLQWDARGCLRVDLPAYEARDVLVYAQAFKDVPAGGGKTRKQVIRGELMGKLSDLSPESIKTGKIGEFKDKAGKILKSNEVWVEGKLYKNGEPVGDTVRRISWGLVRAYNQTLRLAHTGELEVEPGLYYDAAVVMSLQRGGIFHRDVQWKGQIGNWGTYGDRQTARDQGMKFARLVYDLSSLRITRDIASIKEKQGPDRRSQRHYQRAPEGRYMIPFYDDLYEFFSTDEEFATALGRHLPWIKTPDDVIEFLDTYLVQDYANRMMKFRYFYDHEQASLLLSAVLVQNDNSITDSWMEFLFKRAWEYPQALSGLGDNIVTSSTRDGGTSIGSFLYGQGGHIKSSELLENYIRQGGNKKYDLTDPQQYPSMRLLPYFAFEGSAAGRINPGIGDVGGPAEYYGRFLAGRALMEPGWRWHKDPKFAWELVNVLGRGKETDEEWAEIVEAAKKCPRDPYLMTRSRVLSDWGAYITSGTEHDDFRFRREAAIRIGTGWGHAHNDTMDLRLFAFGCTMSGDFNQRPAYGWPRHQMSRCHNLVEVDGKDWMSHAWTRNLFDAPGSPYVSAESIAPHDLESVHLYRRQVALIDVHEGNRTAGGEEKATKPQMDPDVTLPLSYVFDVFRVRGGKTHTYCFHGCLDDAFDVNVKDKQPPTQAASSPDGGYLAPFRWNVVGDRNGRTGLDYWVGQCDEKDLVATWQLDKKAEKTMLSARSNLGGTPTEPQKYTRLTLLDQASSKILQGVARHAKGTGYYGRCLYAQRTSSRPLDSVFVGLIEPYAGEPTITSQKQLAIAGNEKDALKAVAVEVKTKNGHTDILFADGRPDKVRVISDQSSVISGKERECRISAEYAYLSTDDKGLRQATVTGGTLLEGAGIKIEVETARYEGKVSKVDYLNRVVTVDSPIPARLAGHFFEVGGEYHKTSYEVSNIKAGKGQTELSLRKGLEIMRTRVRSVDPEESTVIGTIAMFPRAGRDAGLVGSDDDLKRFWRVAYTGGDRHAGHIFKLGAMQPSFAKAPAGKPAAKRPVFTQKDFPVGAGLRVWEFGVGDTFGIQTGVSLRRVSLENGETIYEVYASSPFTLTIRGKEVSTSADRQNWTPLKGQKKDSNIRLVISEKNLVAEGSFYIRTK